MARTCSIDTHPQRQKIVDALVAEQPYRDIVTWATPSVSTAALSRFKRKALAELRGISKQSDSAPIYDSGGHNVTNSVSRAALTAQASPFRARLQSMWERAERSMDRAETAVRVTMDKESGEYMVAGQDVAAIAPLMAQAHKNLELLGRATGELANAEGPVTNVLIVQQSGSSPVVDDILTIDIGPK